MRRFFQIAILAFLILLSPLAQRAQAQYRFDSWTTDNGLPQASVNSILQTRDGFIWLATFGGLVRFDGLRFQVFNTGNTKGLRTGRFLLLFEDRAGNLWINTEGQGVTRYKDEVFTTYTTEHGLPGSRRSQFEALDQPALRPLPEPAYEYAEWRKARVSLDYHVEVDRHYYSVPHSLLRQQLNVRLTEKTIELFHRGQRVAVHVRSRRQGSHSTGVPGAATALGWHSPPQRLSFIAGHCTGVGV